MNHVIGRNLFSVWFHGRKVVERIGKKKKKRRNKNANEYLKRAHEMIKLKSQKTSQHFTFALDLVILSEQTGECCERGEVNSCIFDFSVCFLTWMIISLDVEREWCGMVYVDVCSLFFLRGKSILIKINLKLFRTKELHLSCRAEWVKERWGEMAVRLFICSTRKTGLPPPPNEKKNWNGKMNIYSKRKAGKESVSNSRTSSSNINGTKSERFLAKKKKGKKIKRTKLK